MSHNCALVIDIGKTSIKASVPAMDGTSCVISAVPNLVNEGDPYPSFDVDAVWEWMLDALEQAAQNWPITHVCVTTHGAAAALIHKNAPEGENGLALPVLDYEWEGVEASSPLYDSLRPDFTESYSPTLPKGLNLGRQLFWQQQNFPGAFKATDCILPYAQYWSWRLCGIAASEVSSLGAHTDLWAPMTRQWSSLAQTQNWDKKFAPLKPAWQSLGYILPAIAQKTGLSSTCKVLTGVHDSNAGYARVLPIPLAERPCLISTGTWAITINPRGEAMCLDPSRDMLMNVDITGAPLACARFMGGREYAEICHQTNADMDAPCTLDALQHTITDGVFALPDFSAGSGPFGGQNPRILGQPNNGKALAILYSALMMDLELSLLKADHGPIVIEGSFADNPMLCSLLAALRPDQSIKRLSSISAIAQGCLTLVNWENRGQYDLGMHECQRVELKGLEPYRRAWQHACNRVEEQ